MSHRPRSARLLQLAAAATVALCALPAQALTVVDVQDGGNLVSTAFVGGALAGLDVGLQTASPVRVTLELEAADLGRDVFFNAIVSLLQQPAREVTVSLGDGARFSGLGLGGARALGTGITAGGTRDDGATWWFRSEADATEFYLGDPLLEGLGNDWLLAFDDPQVGSRFSVSISAVPEPGTWALMLGGLGAVALAARRRG
jgi:hypothetical protein